MHSTSRVTWLARTSATLAGTLILRLRSTLLLRERKPLRAVQPRTGNDPASRLGRSLSTCRRATHRLVGLGRSPASPLITEKSVILGCTQQSILVPGLQKVLCRGGNDG